MHNERCTQTMYTMRDVHREGRWVMYQRCLLPDHQWRRFHPIFFLRAHHKSANPGHIFLPHHPSQVPGSCQPTYGGGGNSAAASCRTVTRQQCQPIQRNVCRQVLFKPLKFFSSRSMYPGAEPAVPNRSKAELFTYNSPG